MPEMIESRLSETLPTIVVNAMSDENEVPNDGEDEVVPMQTSPSQEMREMV